MARGRGGRLGGLAGGRSRFRLSSYASLLSNCILPVFRRRLQRPPAREECSERGTWVPPLSFGTTSRNLLSPRLLTPFSPPPRPPSQHSPDHPRLSPRPLSTIRITQARPQAAPSSTRHSTSPVPLQPILSNAYSTMSGLVLPKAGGPSKGMPLSLPSKAAAAAATNGAVASAEPSGAQGAADAKGKGAGAVAASEANAVIPGVHGIVPTLQ